MMNTSREKKKRGGSTAVGAAPAGAEKSVPTPVAAEKPAKSGGKGRPTPKRRDAQAARQRPLVPSDRKEARRRNRERVNEARSKQNRALMTGDEANYPLAHAGPERRLARDVVDSRFNVAEWLLPFALVTLTLPLILQLVSPALYSKVGLTLIIVLWAGVIVAVLDLILLRSKVRRAMVDRFGSVPPGMVSYALLRATNIRRLRMPRPMIKRGEAPRA
ncbi:hypothetical protein FHX50_000507 [Helcobacillus massiliensis]|uniref:DUF3043 domain-containing protein n=2 Tax=Dermabacteraceae TaxID=85020 RepID=A0A839QTS8_9MICO|nr:hypothetical protein [Helcobacillus massiliensis]